MLLIPVVKRNGSVWPARKTLLFAPVFSPLCRSECSFEFGRESVSKPSKYVHEEMSSSISMQIPDSLVELNGHIRQLAVFSALFSRAPV